MAKGTIFRRYYNGKEYRADSEEDTFNTKRVAMTRARAFRQRGYNARVVRGEFGNRKYAVYHSVEYSRR